MIDRIILSKWIDKETDKNEPIYEFCNTYIIVDLIVDLNHDLNRFKSLI